MRIMIVTDQYPPMVGGVPTVTRSLATDFANRGHQVWVAAPSYGPRDVRRLENKVRVYRFSSFEFPAYEDLRMVVLGNIAQLLAGGLRKPVIATNHYLPINMSRSLTSDPLIGKHFSNVSYTYLVHFYNRCDYVTAPTQTALNLLYEHGLHAPARVISNGIDLKRFTPGPADPHIRQRFNLPLDRPLALHVNRLFDEKPVDVLLDAVPKLKSNTHIALVGTGPAEPELRAQAERLGINDRVSFLGYVRDADLLPLRRCSDLFTIPSEADLQSLATMEAMACGLPVIAANSYALPELAHHEKNGFLFQAGNADELAHAIDRLVGDQELRQRMGEESLTIIQKHDRAEVLNQWEEVYRRLSIEFKEVKERRQQLRTIRKYRGYTSEEQRDILIPRIRRTGELRFDQPAGDKHKKGWRTRQDQA
ncbi:MAG: glycosyltransferase family 4 protein [Chloroflexi bacterium]|nr:MAG: glycosyltransferase family 4 protein [Chloroflexota bacterium]